jgi:exopolysaccharide biosynthesis polyprenyl glycosylphosphotransferase
MAGGSQSVWKPIWLAGTLVSPGKQSEASSPSVSGVGAPLHPAEPGSSQHSNARSEPRGSRLSPRVVADRWLHRADVLVDLVLVTSSGILAFGMRFWRGQFVNPFTFVQRSREAGIPVLHYAAFLMLYAALILLFCGSQGLYQSQRVRPAIQDALKVSKAVFLAILLLSSFIYLSGVNILSRSVVVFAGAMSVLALIVWRQGKRRLVVHRASRGLGTRNALIVGAGAMGQRLAQQLESRQFPGYCFTGFLDANHSSHPKLLGKIADLPQIARARFVDDIFITIPSERELVKQVAAQARLNRLCVNVIPDLYDGLGWQAPITYLGDFPVMELHSEPIPQLGLFFKRLADVASSFCALLLLSPLFLVLAVLVRADSLGPAVYSAPRIGRKGQKFHCYKFRTMVANADALKESLRHLNERSGPTFKIATDPRLTRIGKFLRKYSMDELPQLWNVLKGDMSLVGPRPHPLDDYEQYALDHLRRLDVKPGITGLWQVTARRDPSFETNMRLDLEYIEHWSLMLDFKILLKTLGVTVAGSGS